jgi:hypothetical protein
MKFGLENSRPSKIAVFYNCAAPVRERLLGRLRLGGNKETQDNLNVMEMLQA